MIGIAGVGRNEPAQVVGVDVDRVLSLWAIDPGRASYEGDRDLAAVAAALVGIGATEDGPGGAEISLRKLHEGSRRDLALIQAHAGRGGSG